MRLEDSWRYPKIFLSLYELRHGEESGRHFISPICRNVARNEVHKKMLMAFCVPSLSLIGQSGVIPSLSWRTILAAARRDVCRAFTPTDNVVPDREKIDRDRMNALIRIRAVEFLAYCLARKVLERKAQER